MELTDLHWVAGFLEGEGAFKLAKVGNKTYIRISAASTDEDVIERLDGLTIHGTMHGPYQYKSNNLEYWTWEIAKQKHVAALLMTIYPIMSERRQNKISELLTHWKVS